MKNNYSIAQRNAIVEANLWCIDSVIRQNRPLMRAARLEYDDVYQQLALRLIKAVAGYDPEKGRLEQHIFAQLKYELLSCKSAYRLCGMTGAPHSFRKSHKEETIDLSIIDWDAFQIENVTPENYEWVYHRVFDGWIQGFIHYCRKAPVFQRQERSFF